jgi:hypothetical protein
LRHYRCSECGETALTVRQIDYEYPPGSGNWKQDEEGDMSEGAGGCELCEKLYCAECRDFLDGLCPDCLAVDDNDGIPF